jgi:hypothetical protein
MKNISKADMSEKAITAVLERYDCPTAFPVVRAIFMGNIASPALGVSPLSVLATLWNGELPEFETAEDAQAVVDLLVGGLWNQLADHQSSRHPFRLVRATVQPTRQSLLALATTRQQEIAGFLNGLFGAEDQMYLPEKARLAREALDEARSMFEAAAAVLADEGKPASERDFADFARHAQKMTLIAETHINKTIQSCKRARAGQKEPMSAQPIGKSVLGGMPDEASYVPSPLCRRLTRNGVTVQVEIYEDGQGKWILEVVDPQNTSHVWDEHFASDEEALAEAIRALEEEAMEFVGEPSSARNAH